jgi:transposase
MTANYTEDLTLNVTEEMKKRVKNSEWRSMSEYARQMIRAGESNVAAVDPRITNQDDGEAGITNTDDAEQLAHALSDIALLNELTEDPQPIKEVLKDPTRKFQTVLANRLDELASNDATAVQQDTLEGTYYLDTEE